MRNRGKKKGRRATGSVEPHTEATAAPDQLLQLEHCALNARLCIGVVVLNAIQHLTQHPVGVCLHCIHGLLRQRLDVPGLHWTIKVLTQQGCQEGSDQVVDALDIPTSWMSADRARKAFKARLSRQDLVLLCGVPSNGPISFQWSAKIVICLAVSAAVLTFTRLLVRHDESSSQEV